MSEQPKDAGSANGVLGFTDGLRYLFVLVAPHFEAEPVLIMHLLTLIRQAETHHAVPSDVEVPGIVGKVDWRGEFARQEQAFRARGGFHALVPPSQQASRGRPRRRMESVS